MNLSIDEVQLLEKKFGTDFLEFLMTFEKTANFFVATSNEQTWEIVICMGYSFLAGKGNKNEKTN